MNKAEFLHILRERLSILDENELEDILSEYEQHIDLKAAGTMTEEAAIADFGDIGELTAEILEAYHVRADFDRNKEPEKKNESHKNAVMRAGRKISDSCKKGWESFLQGLENIGLFVQKWAGKCRTAIHNLFSGKKNTEEKAEKKAAKRNGNLKKNRLLSFGSREHEEKRDKMENKKRITLFSVIGMMCKGCAAAVMWCVKAIWNVFCTCAGLLTGLFACVCIFILGTTIVLLAMGYPLLGILLAVLGLTMCTCSFTVLCFTLIIRRKGQAGESTGTAVREADEEEETVHA